MKKSKRSFLSRLSGQSGQALILVLIFLMLGGLTLVPTLTHISTALKTGEIYEKNTDELYTADAGIEDSLWRIKYDFMGPDYNPYDFTSSWPYQTEDLNGMTANFTISNIWFPTDVTLSGLGLTPDTTKQMIESEKLVVNGSALPDQPYRILIDFNPDAGDNLTIKSLGVWLPQGFTYSGSCNLEIGGHSHPYNPDHVTSTQAPGGWTVLWSYDPPYPYLEDFPNFSADDMSFNFTFQYTPPAEHPAWLPAAIAWTTTEMYDSLGHLKLNDVPVSWDIDTRYYKMVSQTGDTSIEAYSSKNELRQMGDAMSGDYVATGNALLLNNPATHCRDTWSTPSSSTLDSIPANADVAYAFLYWSAWRNEAAIPPPIFSDDCTSFNNWDRNTNPQYQQKIPTGDGINTGSWTYTPSSPSTCWDKVDETTPNDTDYITGTTENQVRVPTGDGSSSGTWNSSPYWSKVDETTPNDSDYITGTTDSGGYRLFTFSSFSVPADDTIDGLTIYFRAKDVSGTNPNNNLYARLRVNSNYYNASSSVDPTTTWTTYSYTFTTNPATGTPWTYQDINGSGSRPLQQFGVYSTDFNPDIQVSMAYAQVDFSGGYRLFSFSNFSVPSGATINDLTIYFRAKDASGTNPNNNLQASLRINGTRYDASTSVDPAATWTTYSYTWTNNPETSNPWTYQDINGSGGSHPLQQFGVRSTDFNPNIQISMVYAQVNYSQSLWTISSNQFQGQGSSSTDSGPRTLTLKNSENMTSYGTGVFNITWDQDESGSLSSSDTLYYAFSGDGGTTWSPNYEAFSDDNPASPFKTSIPTEYATSNFKVRFYFNFDSSSKYVYLDNIKIEFMPVDTQITFKINNLQVYFNGNEPADGLNPLTAGRFYAMRNYLSDNPHGFSYDCVRDVSALVKKYPIVAGEQHHTGNAKYTVSDVLADIKNGGSSSEIAFADWSLIIVYACPETAGHYIYIRDDNFCSHTSGDTNSVDFDQDGSPGGTITGFKIPNPITDQFGQIKETVAAKLTCFVVEGDSWYTGDYLKITGQQSALSEYLSNPKSPVDNVWNDKSYPGTISDGVDIDTFEVKWNDGILTPGDKNLQVDMTSDTDAWNLVYFIISIRSETVTSGTTHYTIRGG